MWYRLMWYFQKIHLFILHPQIQKVRRRVKIGTYIKKPSQVLPLILLSNHTLLLTYCLLQLSHQLFRNTPKETKDTCPAPTSSLSDPPSDLDLPIGLRKGKHQCKSVYSIANFVSYDHLSPSRALLLPL